MTSLRELARLQFGVDLAGSDATVAERLIEDDCPWPKGITNEQGWMLWCAHMKQRYGFTGISWEQAVSTDSWRVKLRSLGETFEVEVTRRALVEGTFAGACKAVEKDAVAQKQDWEAERERQLEDADRDFADRAPDMMGELLGFRAWRVRAGRDGKPALHPTGAGVESWDGASEVRAVCGNGLPHRAPDHDCDCGFYGWASVKALIRSTSMNSFGAQRVFGAFVAHGRIEVHPTGIRAEYARPVLLATDDRHPIMEVERIGERLGLPVVHIHDLEREAQKYGSLVPDELRPGLNEHGEWA